MTYLAKRLYQGQLSATTTTVLATVPGGVQWIVTDIEVCNTADSLVRLVTLSMPGSGAGHEQFSAAPIVAGELLQWSGRIVLTAGETICGGADAATDITLTISGAQG